MIKCSHCGRTFQPHQISNCGFCTEFRGCLTCYWERHRNQHNEARGIDMIVKKTGSGESFEPAPQGVHAAICCDVRDLGMQTSHFQGKELEQHKLLISWLIDELREDGKPFLVSKRYTASLHEKAALRKDLESWRGRAFTESELDGFDLENVIEKGAMLNIVHNKSHDGTRTYANITAIMPLPKGMKPPQIPLDYRRYKDREADSAVQPPLPETQAPEDVTPF